jgi:hypothetical protein
MLKGKGTEGERPTDRKAEVRAMLDAYIIDAIRREELEREKEFERRRIWLELELPLPPRDHDKREDKSEEPDQGPVVIPFRPEMPIRNEEDAA